MKNLLLFFFVCVMTLPVIAQKATATVDRKSILIGEQIKLRLQVNFLKGEEAEFFDVDSIPRFEILEKSVIDTSLMDEGFAIFQVFTLTSWDSGKLQLPSFAVAQWKTTPVP